MRQAIKASGAPVLKLSPRDKIVQTLASLDDEKNAFDGLHLISDAREKSGLPKAEFDAALRSLAEDGIVQLQSHDRPSDLTPAEKESLVPNGRGSYFIATGFFTGERAKYKFPATSGVSVEGRAKAWEEAASARQAGIEAKGIAQAKALRAQIRIS